MQIICCLQVNVWQQFSLLTILTNISLFDRATNMSQQQLQNQPRVIKSHFFFQEIACDVSSRNYIMSHYKFCLLLRLDFSLKVPRSICCLKFPINMLQMTGICYIYIIANLNIFNDVLGTVALQVETPLFLFACFLYQNQR